MWQISSAGSQLTDLLQDQAFLDKAMQHNSLHQHVNNTSLLMRFTWVRGLLEGCSGRCPGLNQRCQDGRQDALTQACLHKVGLHVGLGPQHLCCLLWRKTGDVIRVDQGAVAQIVRSVEGGV